MKPIPSLQDLYTKLASDLKSKLGLTDDQLKMVSDALASVLGAQLKLCYLFLQDVQNNVFPDTADTAANGGTLERLGQIYLNRQPFPATEGIYTAVVTGTAGAVIDASTTFKSSDNSNAPGNLYILDAEYTLTGVDDVITIRSLNMGLAYLLKIGDNLGATQPIIGVNNTIAVNAVTQAPEEAESTDIYRQAILDAIRLEPQGGAKTDYRLWASDAQGVRKVYPYVKNGEAGTVQVFTEATTDDSIDGNGTPSDALMTAVAAVIEFDPDESIPTNDRGRRPIQANVDVLPIVTLPVDVVITGLQTTSAAIRAGIVSDLIGFLYDIRPYIAGADLPRDKNDILTAVKLQSVVGDSIGTSNTFLGFAMFVDGVQVNTFTFALANIPYLRNVNYN